VQVINKVMSVSTSFVRLSAVAVSLNRNIEIDRFGSKAESFVVKQVIVHLLRVV
jgi:hypothetical protein